MSNSNWVSVSTPYITPRASDGTEQDAWSAEAARHGGRGTNRVLYAGETQAPPLVCEAFSLEGGEGGAPVVARRRLVLLDETPIEIATAYYPLEVAAGTALVERRKIKGGSITLLAELGYRASKVTEEVTAHMPDHDTRRELHLRRDDPVMTIYRLSRDGHGRPFQVEIMTAPAATRRLRYELEVGDT